MKLGLFSLFFVQKALKSRRNKPVDRIFLYYSMKPMTKKKQKINSGRRQGVLLEDIDSKLDLVVEGHGMLDKKIDRLDKKVDELDEKVHKRFDEVDYKFGVVFDELRLIRHELKEKVSREEFIVLEKRVGTLEKKLVR